MAIQRQQSDVATGAIAPTCPVCGVRPRHVFPSGVANLCQPCLKERQAEVRRCHTLGIPVPPIVRLSNYALAPIPTVGEQSVTPTEKPEREPSQSEPVPQVYGLLADATLMIDRARVGVSTGEITALHIALDVQGARVAMRVERLPNE